MIRQSLLSSLKTLSQNQTLTLTRTVSGTAKGKAKLKGGQVLKRASLPKNKQGSGGSEEPSSFRGGRADKEVVDRITFKVNACLSAPTPIRYLSAAERAREVEREKLGLFSKERQRELDMIKAQKKVAAKEGKIEEKTKRISLGPPGMDYISLGLVDEEAIPKYELTVEDGRRLAKEYSKVLMKRHRARQKAETGFLKLKMEAIEALPEKLKEAALVPDLTPFPTNRYMATLTPPIEGYADQVMEAARKHTVKQKLR